MARIVKNPGKRATAKSAANAVPDIATPYLSAGERRAEGKALRDRVPRACACRLEDAQAPARPGGAAEPNRMRAAWRT